MVGNVKYNISHGQTKITFPYRQRRRKLVFYNVGTWQADALGAVGPHPAHLAGAAVGFCAVALARNAGRLANGLPAVVHLVGVARQTPHVAVPVADVVVVVLKFKIIRTYQTPMLESSCLKLSQGRRDAQHNDIQYNDTQHQGLYVTPSVSDSQYK